MMAAVTRLFDGWRGGGRHAVTVPPMDGVLSPNQAIEDAPLLVSIAAPDNLAKSGDHMVFSSGGSVLRLRADALGRPPEELARFGSAVSALALSDDGGMAVGLEEGGIVIRGGRHDGTSLGSVGGRPVLCPTALSFADPDTLLVVLGSQRNGPAGWRRDLMQRNASGSLWRCGLADGSAICLADGLAWPSGLAASAEGSVVVSESWNSRLLAIVPGSRPRELLSDITGYPGRLSGAVGGYWLCVFAPRSQLVEFVLREKNYRLSMMRELDEDHWIAPALRPARSFLEPMQFGGLKQLGQVKPWAPARSYGLVVALDRDFEPKASFHSRADGRRHGITSCVEFGGRLYASSRGGDAIVVLPAADEE